MAKRGRPKAFDGPAERLDVRVPQHVYDALCRVARRRGDDVRVLARRILTAGISAVEKRDAQASP